jgi:glutamine amidotransferase-like uncharacterized protein
MKPTVALFLHQPKVSVQSGNGLMRALSDEYNFKIFTRHEVESDFFDNVDMIAIPGGIGDSDSFDYLMRENQNSIKKFISDGGKYLGICMGAYWTDKHYFNIMGDDRIEQYIKQPHTDTKRPHAKNISITWNGNNDKMFFYDGCAIIGDETKFKTVARYSNGDPMAVIKNNIGLIGCHPESEIHWYNSYSWMKGLWHDGRHHKLLLDFVNELMER